MAKKKAVNKRKTAAKKKAKRSTRPRLKKETNPTAVRKQVSRIVESEAAKITHAVADEAMKGRLPQVRYLFEMANIFPGQMNSEKATEDNENCLAKILLDRIEAPPKPEKDVEDELEDAEYEAMEKEINPSARRMTSDCADHEKKDPVATSIGTAVSAT
jgi:hypothetical protein